MTGRVFWSLVCLIAACTFAFQLTQLLRKYFSYPRKVVIEVLPLAAPFPSISLCNMRNLDTIVLNRLNRIFLQTNDIGAMLQQFAGDQPPPSDLTQSPPINVWNESQPLYRRRRSSEERDDWMKLMKNVLWKIRRRRTTEHGRTPRSSSHGKKRSVNNRQRKKRQPRQTDTEVDEEEDEDYVDAEVLNDPVNEFIRSYMRAVSKYWPMFRVASLQMKEVFQSVLTRTTIATNINRTILAGAGVPFKEFVVTCRYSIFLRFILYIYSVCVVGERLKLLLTWRKIPNGFEVQIHYCDCSAATNRSQGPASVNYTVSHICV